MKKQNDSISIKSGVSKSTSENIEERQKISNIEKEIDRTLKEIDRKFYNPNFNLMGEIVNIFGDIDFEKVKVDIERLNKIDEKSMEFKDSHQIWGSS